MKLDPTALAAFEKDVIKRYPQEACGLLVDGSYIPCPNSALDPICTFRIDPLHWVKASSMGTVQAVLHSHPYDLRKPSINAPEWPSTKDMEGWLASSVPWGICSTDGEGISPLVWMDEDNPEPLVGRQFISGINDCYSIVRDWYRQERGITLKNFARGMDWWNKGANLYDDNFEIAGFKTVTTNDIQVGDVALFKVRSPVTNHAAVITGTNEILHHIFHRLSGHDELAKWNRVINRVIRYA